MSPSKRDSIAKRLLAFAGVTTRTFACAAIAAIAAHGSVASAQSPMAEFGSGDLRPVREVTAARQYAARNRAVAPTPVRAPVNETLRWRSSTDLKPAPHHLPTEDVFAVDTPAPGRVVEDRPTLPNPMRSVRTAQYYRPDDRAISSTAPANKTRSAATLRTTQPQPGTVQASTVQSGTVQSGTVQQAAWSNETRAILNEALQNDAPPMHESDTAARDDFFGDPFGDSKHATASAKLNRAASRPRYNQQFNDYQKSNRQNLNATADQRLALQFEMVPPNDAAGNTSGSPSASNQGKISNPFRDPGNSELPVPKSAAEATLPDPSQPSIEALAPTVQEAPEFDSLFQDAPKASSDASAESTLPSPSQESGNLFDSINGDSPAMDPKSDDGSIRDLLESVDPRNEIDDSTERLPEPERKSSDATESPSDREDLFANPFPKKRGDADQDDLDRLRERMELRRRKRSEAADDADEPEESDLSDSSKSDIPDGLTCDQFRQRISRETIRTLSLDISAPFRPDVFETDEYEKLKAKFDAAQPVRQWTSVNGSVIASGRLRDLAYEKAVIETDLGGTQEISLSQLSEGDWAYISKNWGLPKECRLEQVAYQPRSWQPHTFTWKASNLCHKPLYFEEVNLERYGHTAGPFLQPVVSSAHFFANIAVLPYKMGIHPPGECQYALGYYRPGNCAPWIIPPVPLSLRGAAAQAAVVTTGFWLIP